MKPVESNVKITIDLIKQLNNVHSNIIFRYRNLNNCAQKPTTKKNFRSKIYKAAVFLVIAESPDFSRWLVTYHSPSTFKSFH